MGQLLSENYFLCNGVEPYDYRIFDQNIDQELSIS